MSYESIDELVLDSINKNRPMTQAEFFERLERNGKKHQVMILLPQISASAKRLLAAQKLKIVTEGGVKKIVKL